MRELLHYMLIRCLKTALLINEVERKYTEKGLWVEVCKIRDLAENLTGNMLYSWEDNSVWGTSYLCKQNYIHNKHLERVYKLYI